jgi:hypothetical protein
MIDYLPFMIYDWVCAGQLASDNRKSKIVNPSGESSSVWLEHQIVVLRVAGSNPVFHPSRERAPKSQACAAPAQEKTMSSDNFPPGWDQERVRRVLEHYESQSDEEAVAEDEAAFEATAPQTPNQGDQ